MKGTASASGAISFLNALFTGTGAAAGIDLWASVSVELEATSKTQLSVGREGDSPLVRAVAAQALARWSPGRTYRASVEVRSAVPAARGLKSSSAVGSATSAAVASALGVHVPPPEVARLTAEVSRGIGQSATGAFDDALASLVPGIHVTDNRRDRALRDEAAPPDWRVLLGIPSVPHPPSVDVAPAFGARCDDARPAERCALEGRWLEAMDANSALVESVLGYPYASLRRELREAGALGSGVSGLGPAVAVIVRAGEGDHARHRLEDRFEEVIETRFTPTASRSSGGTR